MSMSILVESNTAEIERKFSQQSRDRAQYTLGNQMLADMNMYVPFKESPLRQTGHMSEHYEFLIWNTPYAAYQYYNQFPSENYTTPGTGGRWDLVAKANHMNSWERAWLKGAGF